MYDTSCYDLASDYVSQIKSCYMMVYIVYSHWLEFTASTALPISSSFNRANFVDKYFGLLC